MIGDSLGYDNLKQNHKSMKNIKPIDRSAYFENSKK